MKKLWRLWALSLGEKASEHDHEADKVAIIRTLIFASYLITNIAIVANAWRHWHKAEPTMLCKTSHSKAVPPSLL